MLPSNRKLETGTQENPGCFEPEKSSKRSAISWDMSLSGCSLPSGARCSEWHGKSWCGKGERIPWVTAKVILAHWRFLLLGQHLIIFETLEVMPKKQPRYGEDLFLQGSRLKKWHSMAGAGENCNHSPTLPEGVRDNWLTYFWSHECISYFGMYTVSRPQLDGGWTDNWGTPNTRLRWQRSTRSMAEWPQSQAVYGGPLEQGEVSKGRHNQNFWSLVAAALP